MYVLEIHLVDNAATKMLEARPVLFKKLRVLSLEHYQQ